METPVILAGIVALIVVLRLAAGALDDGRIRGYFERRGCRLVAKRWTPFGKGWFGESTERLYEVEYDDGAGRRHAATVKTSLFTGVFLSEDRVVAGPAAPAPHATDAAAPADADEVERLRAENARLRAELEKRTDA